MAHTHISVTLKFVIGVTTLTILVNGYLQVGLGFEKLEIKVQHTFEILISFPQKKYTPLL